MFGEEMRFGRRWDPWRELNRLQDEVNRLFSGALEAPVGNYPQLRVWSNDEEAFVDALIPGVDPSKVEISVLGDSVTISGKRERTEPREGVTTHRREREYGEFTRTLQLPFRIEADKVKAEFRRGILQLTLPRAIADRPRRIQVKAD